jgi:hypothetical protein
MKISMLKEGKYSVMCEQCVEIDKTIERYRRITRSIRDDLVLERAEELIAALKARKPNFIPGKRSKGRLDPQIFRRFLALVRHHVIGDLGALRQAGKPRPLDG